MYFSAATLAFAAALASTAHAHGSLQAVAIDGTIYKGGQVGSAAPAGSPIRQITDVSPVKGASNKDLACGFGSPAPAPFVAPANPGSSVSFAWQNGGGGNWPHNVGPVMTYMAACTGTTCDKFDASGAKWFKIHQAGRKDDGSTWYQADIMQGNSFTVDLPNDLSPGDYLIRHELISLQGAMSNGGAEFYPSCTQVRVGGSQTGTPAATLSFPGAYSDSDPGILVDVYSGSKTYTFPGGAVSNLAAAGAAITAPESQWAASGPGSGSSVSGGSGGSPAGSSASGAAASGTATASGAAASATSTAAPGGSGSGSGGSCHLTTKTKRAVKVKRSALAQAVHRPQQVSRIMRRLLGNDLELLEPQLGK